MPTKKLDYHMFNDPATEQEAIKQHAYAIAAIMEAIVIVKMTFDNEGFPEYAREEFEKALKRATNAVMSVLPNQWKNKVLQLIADTAKESLPEPAAVEETTAQEVTPDATTNNQPPA